MRIPKKLKIAGHVYSVRYPYKFKERYDRNGQSNHDTAEVFVSAVTQNGHKRPRTLVEETFMHEIVHCVDVQYNASKLDEDTVERIACGLYQTLKDNGMLR